MLNLQFAVNNLSFGFVSTNILFELFKRNIQINLFPIGGNVDLTSYPAAKNLDGFENWLKESIFLAPERFNKNDPSFSLWHINGSEQSIGSRRNLLTFHELSEVTPVEKNILNNIDTVFVTSEYTGNVFLNAGVKNVVNVPLGFDNLHFKNLHKKIYQDDRIVFGLAGKLEVSRKAHEKVIKNWIKKFGNNKKYQLHLHVTNPFFTPEQNAGLLNQIFENKKPFNVNVLPYVKDLNLLNNCFNAFDIILDMSRAEGFSLPSFHCVGMGKHAVIHNCTGMKEWATAENAVLVESVGKIEPYDNIFFHKGSRFNNGMIWDWNDDEFCAALDAVIERFKQNPINSAGFKIQENFTWKKTVDGILNNLKN